MSPNPIPSSSWCPRSRAMEVYDKGVGISPRLRGLPYNLTSHAPTGLVAQKVWNGVRSRRIFVRSTEKVLPDTPIEATPTTTAEKKTRIERRSQVAA